MALNAVWSVKIKSKEFELRKIMMFILSEPKWFRNDQLKNDENDVTRANYYVLSRYYYCFRDEILLFNESAKNCYISKLHFYIHYWAVVSSVPCLCLWLSTKQIHVQIKHSYFAKLCPVARRIILFFGSKIITLYFFWAQNKRSLLENSKWNALNNINTVSD